MKICSCILLVVSLVSIKGVYEDEFNCFDFITVTDQSTSADVGVYVGSSDFPALIPWENRSECHFNLRNESNEFIFIITNGYLRNVRIICDKVIK